MNPRPESPNELAVLLEAVLDDYDPRKPPFDEWRVPEHRVIPKMDCDDSELARYLTLVAAVDYRKETEGPEGLWQVTYRFWRDDPWMFDPTALAEEGRRDDLERVFEDYDLFWAQDVDIWYRNATTLHEHFDDDPVELLAENEFDAVSTKEYLRQHGSWFPYLKGDKICPLWLRLMHEEIHELDSIEQIDIPVDYRIRQITGELMDREFEDTEEDNKEVRDFWGSFCRNNGFVPVHIDQPLWLLAKYWEEGGKEYLENKLTEIR